MRKRRKNECSETPYSRFTELHPLDRCPRPSLDLAPIRYRSITRRADRRMLPERVEKFRPCHDFVNITLRRKKCQARNENFSLFFQIVTWQGLGKMPRRPVPEFTGPEFLTFFSPRIFSVWKGAPARTILLIRWKCSVFVTHGIVSRHRTR